MPSRYKEWKAFYEGHITDWMTTEALQQGCGGLLGSYPDSTEVLLIHAMHRIEELEAQVSVIGGTANELLPLQ
jgi:hypothetical protein